MAPDLKGIGGMASRMRRRYSLPAGTEEDLIQAARLALIGLDGKSPAYRIVVAKNAMLAEIRKYLPKGFGASAMDKAFAHRPISLDALGEWRSDFSGEPQRGSFTFIDEQALFRAVRELPQRQRIVIEIRFGLNGARANRRWHELAGKLGCSVDAVQAVFDEAMEELRERMGQRG